VKKYVQEHIEKKDKVKMVSQFAKLINVKTVVTFVVIAVFAILSLRGEIETQTVTNIVLMVIAFYFGTQHDKDKKAE
jgi:uncharacterized protein (DUF486 family)